MRAETGPGPDWRDAAAYAPLLDAERSVLAWEWLRRDLHYRSAALRALGAHAPAEQASAAAAWGLHAFEDPGVPAPLARPMWRADVHPAVLAAVAKCPRAQRDVFDLARIAPATAIVAGPEREHLLISDGLRTIRLDIVAGSVTKGPAELHYLLSGIASAERPLLTLRRLLAFQRMGRFSRSLHPPEARARRWILMLRAHDALAAGADQREIAAALLNKTATEPCWRSNAPSLRSQAQRLVRNARLAAGAYRRLLI